MRAFRRIISTLLAAALILTPAFDLALPLLAADTEDTAAADEIPEEIILAGFDSGVDGFRKSDNIRAVEAITSSDGSRI